MKKLFSILLILVLTIGNIYCADTGTITVTGRVERNERPVVISINPSKTTYNVTQNLGIDLELTIGDAEGDPINYVMSYDGGDFSPNPLMGTLSDTQALKDGQQKLLFTFIPKEGTGLKYITILLNDGKGAIVEYKIKLYVRA